LIELAKQWVGNEKNFDERKGRCAMHNTLWLAIIPALVTITLSIWTKQILPSLFVGLIVGGMLKSMSIIHGIPTALDSIVQMLSDTGNLQVLLFLYLFSGLVLLIKNSGGIEAFTSKIKQRTEKKRSVFYTIWGLIPFTFIDCGFRVIAAGSMIRTLGDKYEVSKERLARC
jgi:tetracycline resistance efflux pump